MARNLMLRWDPFRELAALQNQLSRFTTAFEGNGGNGRGESWLPAVDVWETESELVYAFDLPGVEEDKISIELQDGSLTVSAERERTEETKDDRFYRYERRFGTFSRTIGVPQGVNEDAISASYNNGVLEVHVPKPEEAKPRRIQVGSGQHAAIEGEATRT